MAIQMRNVVLGSLAIAYHNNGTVARDSVCGEMSSLHVVRLFAAVVVLACLITSILFIRLFGWRSEVILIDDPESRPMSLRHRVATALTAVEHHTNISLQKTNVKMLAKISVPSSNASVSKPAVSQPTLTSPTSLSTATTAAIMSRYSPLAARNIHIFTKNTPSPPTHPTNASSDTQTVSTHPSQSTSATPAHPSKSTSATPPHPSVATSTSGQGYALTVNYYEQQTMGLRNMMQLQCWAQSLGLCVVKPVMHDSFLRTPLDSSHQASYLKFEDSFDEQEWNHYSEKLGYALLVSWKEFMASAPRDVVLVSFEHPSVSMLKARQKAGQGLFQSPDPQRYTTGCSSKWPSASETTFLRTNGFNIIRKVCFNFYHGDQLSLETFNGHILEGLAPNSVTVIMETWRGISSAQRVLVKDVCQNTALVQERLHLSSHLGQQAEQYIHKYLGASRQYLAIMGRLEISLLTVHKKVPVVPFCLEETLSQWKKFKSETHLDRTFLSIDIGRYGSKKYRSKLDPELDMVFHKFFQTLFGSSLTVREWEKQFELITGSSDAGYIGLLQKMLVTRAQCVLFVGGGAFQRHALYLYKQLHPDPKDQCYRIVKTCTNSSKLS